MNIPAILTWAYSDQLEELVDQENIRLVVIAMERTEQEEAEKMVQRLSEKDVEIKIIPDILDILSGSVKTSNLFGALLTDIHTGLMPEWQMHIKRLVDVLFSVFALILLSPLLLVCSHSRKTEFSPAPFFIRRKEPVIKERNS